MVGTRAVVTGITCGPVSVVISDDQYDSSDAAQKVGNAY
jgi:hypothetical protein